jgi:predicted peptidase
MQTAILTPLIILSLVTSLVAADPVSEMTAQTFTASDGLVLPYRVWQAPVTGDERLPLVIFLHGAGGRGNDNRTQLRDGLVQLLAAIQQRHPCVLIAPQCPADVKWTGINWQQRPLAERTPKPTRPAAAVLELIAELITMRPIDRTRIYLTGVSMGGSGTWDLATRAPGLFAAIMPVCGGCDVRNAALWANQSLWAFPGARDTVVTPDLARSLIAELRANGQQLKYTEYPDAGHDIGSKVYGEAESLRWLFSQARPP